MSPIRSLFTVYGDSHVATTQSSLFKLPTATGFRLLLSFFLLSFLPSLVLCIPINTESVPPSLPRSSPSSSSPVILSRDPASVSMVTSGSLAAEGSQTCHTLWSHFWDSSRQHFTTVRASSETIGDWNGYVIWPFIIGIEALLEAEAAQPGQLSQEIGEAFKGTDKFFSPEFNAYCAWLYGPGNADIYYDDNAQVAIGLMKAYKMSSTRNETYLIQAKKVIGFLFTGWAPEGGMHWHVSKTDRNAISTSLTAVAVLQLAEILREEGRDEDDKTDEELIEFATRCVNWILGELQLDTGLIKDGATGGPTYTYNTGMTIHAICLLQTLNPTPGLMQKAQTLAIAALDPNKSLFDLSVPNQATRYWWDNNFFLHLLLEGLGQYVTTFGGQDPDTAAKIKTEVARQMNYVVTYIRDANDGMYWRSLQLYTISMGHLAVYKNLTGDTTREPQLSSSERWTDPASLSMPVGQRGMCKTLLGTAGAARSALIAARII